MLDVPRSEAAVLDALEGVAAIMIVANQELATVRNAGRMAGDASAALRQGSGAGRDHPLRQAGRDQQEDVERVIGSPVKHTVPSDYRVALKALNKGRPLALDGDGKLGEAFQAIAYDLAGIRVEEGRDADEERACSADTGT